MPKANVGTKLVSTNNGVNLPCCMCEHALINHGSINFKLQTKWYVKKCVYFSSILEHELMDINNHMRTLDNKKMSYHIP
jgi:hypothetical protein